jgi:hypothetical protein
VILNRCERGIGRSYDWARQDMHTRRAPNPSPQHATMTYEPTFPNEIWNGVDDSSPRGSPEATDGLGSVPAVGRGPAQCAICGIDIFRGADVGYGSKTEILTASRTHHPVLRGSVLTRTRTTEIVGDTMQETILKAAGSSLDAL